MDQSEFYSINLLFFIYKIRNMYLQNVCTVVF